MNKEKEPEFILSPEELKKNQDRSYAREYYEKKEARERRYEKLIFMLSIMMIVMLIIALNVQFKKGVEECVNAGHDRTFCEVELS